MVMVEVKKRCEAQVASRSKDVVQRWMFSVIEREMRSDRGSRRVRQKYERVG